MSLAVMKLALEALEEINKLSIGENAICLPAEIDTAMDAIRQAIEKAAYEQPFCYHDGRDIVGKEFADHSDVFPLYTSPPQRQPWVGLTGDEVNEFAAGCHLGNSVQGAIRKAEAKIKEKNI
jgi:hypothetical protein